MVFEISLRGRWPKLSPDPSDPGYSVKDRVCGNNVSVRGLGLSGHAGVEIVDLFLTLDSRGQIQDLRGECLHSGSCCGVVPGQKRVSHHPLTVAHSATLHHDIKLEERERCQVEARVDQMCEVKG